MTDTSLPNQPSVSSNDDSYVSSYAPPSGANDAAASKPASGSVPNMNPVPSASATNQTASQGSNPGSTGDPLAELEKALKEYEERQKQLADKQQDVTKKANEATKKDDQTDPLVELEKVLDEYEERYKQAQQAEDNSPSSNNQSGSAPIPAASASSPTDDQDEKVLTQAEYQSILKNEPIKPVNEPTTPTAPAQTSSTPPSAAPVTAGGAQSNQAAEPIEQQNIFELLGVMDAKDEEKEAFLDELQQALWEDFLDKDVELLVNADQLKEISDLRSRADLDEKAKQEQLIAKVEQLVPDVEEIMLEKALELKEDMVRERIAGMKEYYAAKPDQLAKIQEAEQHIAAGRWHTGAQMLNSLIA